MIAVIDLFAGAGGFGVGVQKAGADLRLSVELEPVACVTLKENAGPSHEVLEADVTKLTGSDLRSKANLSSTEPVIIVGGAPCQPFSKASNWIDAGLDHEWRKQRAAGNKTVRPPVPKVRPDDRRSLVDHFARLVTESKADAFVFENVAALMSKRNKPVLDKFISDLDQEGYHIRLVKHFASEFGVAQHRERVFVIGSRNKMPDEPQPTHWAKRPVSGLQQPTAVGLVCEKFAGKKFFEPEEVVTGTYAEHLNEIDAGRNYKQLTDWAGYPQLTGRESPFVAERRYWNFLLVLEPSIPSWTIPAVYGSWTGPFHWENKSKTRRRLRTTELAAIQDFPSNYVFSGSWRERVRQIGNAVPPSLAAVMVTEAMKTLDR